MSQEGACQSSPAAAKGLKNWLRLFPPLALSASVIFLLLRLSDYEACFQDPESLANFAPHALKDGNAIGLHDLTNCFNVWGLDGDSRPRPVSYLFYVLSLKCRLALWKIVPMHPSFSPLWLLTLVVGPILFYKFLRLTFDSTPLAQLGTALYFTSPALLSSAVFLFHPAKPLANVAMILALYLAAKANRRASAAATANPRLPLNVALAWMLLMPLMLLADETVVFCLLVPIAWSPAFFVPRSTDRANVGVCLGNAAILAVPALLYAAFVLLAMPRISEALFGMPFDFLAYATREKLRNPGKFGATFAIRHFVELLTAAYLPWPIVGRPVPVCFGPPWNPWGLFVLYLSALSLVLGAVRNQQTYWSIGKRTVLLAAGSIAFTSYVSSHHDMEMVLTGFYYGGMSNILLVVLATNVTAAVARRATAAPWAAPLLVVCLMTLQNYNFSILTASWREHHNFKMLGWLMQLPYNPYLTDGSLEQIRPLVFGKYQSMHAPDTAAAADGGGYQYMVQLWRDREAAPAVPAPLALRDIWVIVELYYLRGPDHVTDLPTRAGWEQLDSPAARALQWQHVAVLGLALERLRSAAGDAMPVTGLRRAPADNALIAAVAMGSGWGRLGYPLFTKDLRQGLDMLRGQNYDLLVVESRTLATADAVSASWGFHHAFREAWQNDALRKLGVNRLGEIRLVGRDLTIFELAR